MDILHKLRSSLLCADLTISEYYASLSQLWLLLIENTIARKTAWRHFSWVSILLCICGVAMAQGGLALTYPQKNRYNYVVLRYKKRHTMNLNNERPSH